MWVLKAYLASCIYTGTVPDVLNLVLWCYHLAVEKGCIVFGFLKPLSYFLSMSWKIWSGAKIGRSGPKSVAEIGSSLPKMVCNAHVLHSQEATGFSNRHHLMSWRKPTYAGRKQQRKLSIDAHFWIVCILFTLGEISVMVAYTTYSV